MKIFTTEPNPHVDSPQSPRVPSNGSLGRTT